MQSDQGTKLVFACSGAADVGAIADQASRKLRDEGVVRMSCVAGLTGRIPGIMNAAKETDVIIAIDGCPLDCVAHALHKRGMHNFRHLRVTDLGLVKGESPPNETNIAKVAEKAADLL